MNVVRNNPLCDFTYVYSKVTFLKIADVEPGSQKGMFFTQAKQNNLGHHFFLLMCYRYTFSAFDEVTEMKGVGDAIKGEFVETSFNS